MRAPPRHPTTSDELTLRVRLEALRPTLPPEEYSFFIALLNAIERLDAWQQDILQTLGAAGLGG